MPASFSLDITRFPSTELTKSSSFTVLHSTSLGNIVQEPSFGFQFPTPTFTHIHRPLCPWSWRSILEWSLFIKKSWIVLNLSLNIVNALCCSSSSSFVSTVNLVRPMLNMVFGPLYVVGLLFNFCTLACSKKLALFSFLPIIEEKRTLGPPPRFLLNLLRLCRERLYVLDMVIILIYILNHKKSVSIFMFFLVWSHNIFRTQSWCYRVLFQGCGIRDTHCT